MREVDDVDWRAYRGSLRTARRCRVGGKSALASDEKTRRWGAGDDTVSLTMGDRKLHEYSMKAGSGGDTSTHGLHRVDHL